MHLEIGQILTQIVAFLLMLWILKKFAWGPLLKVMDDREQKIRDEFAGIEQQKADLRNLEQKYQDQLETIDNLSRQRIQAAVQEGRNIAADIQEKAHAHARTLMEQMKSDLAREVEQAKIQLKNDLVAMTVDATKKMIGETLTPEKQNALVAYFAQRTDLK